MDLLPAAEGPAVANPSNDLVADGPAFVREWKPPVYPAEALKEKPAGA